jgi:hypothetical protein
MTYAVLAALLEIQTLTLAIHQLACESTRMLKAIGAYPYGCESDVTADKHSRAFYGSDIDLWNYSSSLLAGAYEHEYNSNGLPWNY